MAGSRHHYIPRFLQKGFASHIGSKGVFAWIYRKDGSLFNTNIINVGVEGNFYTQDAKLEADSIITKSEEVLGSLVEELRLAPLGAFSNANIGKLIAHLEIRTRHLRENFQNVSNYIVGALIDFLSDSDRFNVYMKRNIQNDPSILKNAINETMKENKIPIHKLEVFSQIVRDNYPRALKALKPMHQLFFESAKNEYLLKIKEGAKKGHIKALLKSVAPPIRVDYYDNLQYRIIEDENAKFILGDSILIFQLESESQFRPYSAKQDKPLVLYLPLTPKRLLIGSNSGLNIIPDNFNKIIARCSLEYFIACENSSEYQSIQKSIGELAAVLTTSEMDAIVADAIYKNN